MMTALLADARNAGTSDAAAVARYSLTQIRDELADSDHALRRHLARMYHHKEVELGPTELGGWQPCDPKTGLTPFDEAGNEVERATPEMLNSLMDLERNRSR
jgi:hypothetical protein